MNARVSGPIETVGKALNRPECVMGAPSGDVYVTDGRGGVGVVRANGSQDVWLARSPGFDFKPNGFALHPDGGFLIANLGDDGGIWRLSLDGGLEPLLKDLDGEPLPPSNFVYIDEDERICVRARVAD